MKTFSQPALLAGTIIFITALASNAFCQDGLQRIEAQPDGLQAVPEPAGAASVAADGDCQSCSDGCASRPQGCLVDARADVSSMMHSGQPLIDPWARADWIAAQRAATQSWHAGYYHTAWGAPVALVVPPTARMQTRMGWGVSQTTVSPIYQQFERPYPGGMTAEGGAMPGVMPLRPTPRWPSHTDQFGVYYVRGPW